MHQPLALAVSVALTTRAVRSPDSVTATTCYGIDNSVGVCTICKDGFATTVGEKELQRPRRISEKDWTKRKMPNKQRPSPLLQSRISVDDDLRSIGKAALGAEAERLHVTVDPATSPATAASGGGERAALLQAIMLARTANRELSRTAQPTFSDGSAVYHNMTLDGVMPPVVRCLSTRYLDVAQERTDHRGLPTAKTGRCVIAPLGPPLHDGGSRRQNTVVVLLHGNETSSTYQTVTASCTDPAAPLLISSSSSRELAPPKKQKRTSISTWGGALFPPSDSEELLLPPGMPAFRYITLFRCSAPRLVPSGDAICLAFKVHDFIALVSADGRDFSRSPMRTVLNATVGLDRVLAAVNKTHNMAHNLAGPLALPGTNGTRHLLLGGLGRFRGLGTRATWRMYNGQRPPAPALRPDKRAGILITHGPGWAYDSTSWSEPHVALSTSHPGCVDRRLRTGYGLGCEYDGRLSVVIHPNGTYLLYARANLDEFRSRGGRFVMVASSTDAKHWSPFRMLSLDGYVPDDGDVYFFAAQVNPIDETSLVALFPLSLPPDGAIMIAFSRDGVRWSGLRRVVMSRIAAGGRTEDHPVAGGVVLDHASGRVHIYVQLAVPGIAHRYGIARRKMVCRRARARSSAEKICCDGAICCVLQHGRCKNQSKDLRSSTAGRANSGVVKESSTSIVRYALDAQLLQKLTRQHRKVPSHHHDDVEDA